MPSSLLDWLIRALSLFNCILSLWLGLTILLNAERRRWGTWVAGGGLVLNGAFFVVHSAIVGRDMAALGAEFALWWPAVLLPFIGLPYLWYVVVAWYTGQLSSARGRLALGLASAVGVFALVLIGVKLWLATDIAAPAIGPFMLGPLPASALIFPAYSIVCIALALDAVRRPATAERFMGDAARDRARPWLVATSLVLLVISIVAGSALIWLLNGLGLRQVEVFSFSTLTTLKILDLVVSALVALAIVFVGQAAVSYEVFTGHVLPRRGLYRQWRQALLTAAVFGVLVAASIGLPVDPVYPVLVGMLLLTLALTIGGRRTYVEREQTTETLRALMESDRSYERLTQEAGAENGSGDPLAILCREVLGAEVGYLLPLGPLAALAGPAISYPEAGHEAPALDGLVALGEVGPACRALDPTRHGGARWAVRLGGEGPAMGLLLLGGKADGSLYTEEEIALARATGERVIESRASAELGRRLIAIQRGRIAESQIADRQMRRLLHDEVLPDLHTALLTTSDQTTGKQLADLHRLISDALHSLQPMLSGRAARDGLIAALRHLVDVEMADSFEAVALRVEAGADAAAASISELSREVAYGATREVVRNAARHARGDAPDRPLHVEVIVENGQELSVTVADDGVGLANGGAEGSGLALHATMMAVIGGSLNVESKPGSGTRATVAVPLTSYP